MHPRKNMIRCCQYIGRKAWEYVQDELKAKGITPNRENPYGSAIPEGVCYQWAEDYFNDPDAKEDHEEEEKFVPKPYYGGTSKSKTVKKGKKDNKPKKPEEKKPQSKPAESSGQISLGDFIVPEEKAGYGVGRRSDPQILQMGNRTGQPRLHSGPDEPAPGA